MINIKKILTSMGYRYIGTIPANGCEKIWAKPVGHNLFTIQLESLRWTCLFPTADGKSAVWTSRLLHEDSLKDDLVMQEAFDHKTVYHGALKDYSFLTKEEEIRLILD